MVTSSFIPFEKVYGEERLLNLFFYEENVAPYDLQVKLVKIKFIS